MRSSLGALATMGTQMSNAIWPNRSRSPLIMASPSCAYLGSRASLESGRSLTPDARGTRACTRSGVAHREVDCQGPSHRAADHAERVDGQVIQDRDHVLQWAKRHDRRGLGTAEAALVVADDSIAITQRVNGARPHSRVRDSGVQEENSGPRPDNIEAQLSSAMLLPR